MSTEAGAIQQHSAKDVVLFTAIAMSAGTGAAGRGAVGGITRSGTGVASSGATAVSAKVASKIEHIFGNASHNLDALLDVSGGSRQAAFDALQTAANRALANGELKPSSNGVLPGSQSGAVLNVNGVDVQMVGGRVVDDTVELGSASRRFLKGE